MATKPAIVTKKQLEDSGFDNLRDYLNAERGLTRRDGQVAVRKGEMDIKSPAEKRSATRMADVAAQKPSAERRSDTRLRDSQSASASSNDANMLLVDSAVKEIGGGRSGGRGGAEAGEGSESKPAGAFRGTRSDPKPEGAYRGTRSDPKPEGAYRGTRSDMKKGGAVKKMASGGSASSRADGIAQRGKTKGRVC
jgi:hypothetical protein